jgi:hypothetical protein
MNRLSQARAESLHGLLESEKRTGETFPKTSTPDSVLSRPWLKTCAMAHFKNAPPASFLRGR